MVFLAMMTDDGCQGNPMDKSPRKRNGGPHGTWSSPRRDSTARDAPVATTPKQQPAWWNLWENPMGKCWRFHGILIHIWRDFLTETWGVWKTKDKCLESCWFGKKKLGCKKSIANLPNKQDHLTRRNNHVLPIRIVTSIQMGRWPLTIGVLQAALLLGQLISWKIPWLFKVYIVTPDPDVPERILQWYSHACCSSWMK